VIQYDIISLNAWNGVIFVGASSNAVDGCTIEANGLWGIIANVGGNDFVDNTLVNNLSGSIDVI
jgi:Periplasmic copper-binding protein (NosD)